MCVHVCVLCVRACVCACVRVCVRACACVLIKAWRPRGHLEVQQFWGTQELAKFSMVNQLEIFFQHAVKL